MFTTGVILLFCSSAYIGYKVGNKYEVGIWTKEAKPKKIGGGILERFRKMDRESL